MTALGVTAASRLRALMRERGMITAPGAYDCIGARLIEQAGFAAVYMTGAGTAATLGYPDFGLLTMTEMVENAGRLAAAVTIPVVADADTGYGNELNVVRTVREYEKRGVAGIHIEDQGFPKRCGHLDNKEIIAARGLSRQDPRRRLGQEEPGLRHHRAHRLARLARPRGGGQARQRLARRGRRHGLHRGPADGRGGRRHPAPGQGALPAQRGVGRQDARPSISPRPRSSASSSPSCRACSSRVP